MSVKIKTLALQDATSKAIKGVGKVGMLAITTAICIEVKDGLLTLSTTNNVNNMEVKVNVGESEDFYACTDADLFSKLVAKTDSEFIELSIEDSCLQFVGAGAYNLPLIQDEEGNMGRITPIILDSTAISFKLSNNDLQNIINYNKLAVAKTFEEILYTNYFIGDNKCITYNSVTACNSNIKLDTTDKFLVPATLINLLSVYTEPEVTVLVDKDKIKFETDMITISGTLCEGIENYPVQPLLDLFDNQDYTKSENVNTALFKNCLDRLALFTVDNSDIILNFTADSLILQNKDSNACEEVPYTVSTTETDTNDEYSNSCDINDLQPIINAISTESVELVYGYSQGLKICADGVEYIIPWISNEEEENA